MAQPLGNCLRPARRSGLTSPDPVRTPDARQGTRPQDLNQHPDKPQNRQRQAKHALKALIHENDYAKSIGGLRLRRPWPRRLWAAGMSGGTGLCRRMNDSPCKSRMM
jgi:hypothetical protein